MRDQFPGFWPGLVVLQVEGMRDQFPGFWPGLVVLQVEGMRGQFPGFWPGLVVLQVEEMRDQFPGFWPGLVVLRVEGMRGQFPGFWPGLVVLQVEEMRDQFPGFWPGLVVLQVEGMRGQFPGFWPGLVVLQVEWMRGQFPGFWPGLVVLQVEEMRDQFPGFWPGLVVLQMTFRTMSSVKCFLKTYQPGKWNISDAKLKPQEPQPSDGVIRHSCTPKTIGYLARVGLFSEEVETYGTTRAKVCLEVMDRLKAQPDGKYVVVTWYQLTLAVFAPQGISLLSLCSPHKVSVDSHCVRPTRCQLTLTVFAPQEPDFTEEWLRSPEEAGGEGPHLWLLTINTFSTDIDAELDLVCVQVYCNCWGPWKRCHAHTGLEGVPELWRWGLANLPIYKAKTHLSLFNDSERIGVKSGIILPIRDIHATGGAAFLNPLVSTMSAPPQSPAFSCFYDNDLSRESK
ncbi:uncharacterized protein LOC129817886 [Salvelinus fontinalis]|uniref:uncharacterized protein LOC129817886 n=1 Tax=Salvelinus fontinalis TaxID=8038 RepID=UPI002485F7EC|nr:uncharacterized protein LOC129817886 [Salvelinus fontinalis]